MKQFLGDDYLLDNKLAVQLYEEHAKKMPIFDFHCHLSPSQILEDYHFSTITEAWIGKDGKGDHYKWRLLREAGVSEDFITGNKSDWEKFEAFASVLPTFFANPIYEWCHLELKDYFGINEPLSKKNAKEVYDKANGILKTLSVRKMLEKMNVDTLFTTDDPADDLHYHELMAKDSSLQTKVFPCFRPDKALNIEAKGYLDYIHLLEHVTSRSLSDFSSFLSAFDDRLMFFVDHGCVASDQGLEILYYSPYATKENAGKVYQKALQKEELTKEEIAIYKTYLLLHLGKEYRKLNMVQQYHMGAIRNNNQVEFEKHGPDFGYDSIDDKEIAYNLNHILSDLNKTDDLPKTVLYCINPKDYPSVSTLMNNFQDGKIRGKIQLGAAWWFNDNYNGIRKQLQALSDVGLIHEFIGMLTDSRSFLSYPRHDYFRRVLCQYISEFVEEGRYPLDEEFLSDMVERISYYNAKEYFKR